MDEKLTLPDSSLFILTQDSTQQKTENTTDHFKTKDGLVGTLIVLALTITIVILFNTRSK
jgi:hypothetical protein